MGAIVNEIQKIRLRDIPRATRAALESTFWHWHQAYAPQHFTRGAFGRYSSYDQSRKSDREEWLRRHARDVARGRASRDANPLVRRGKLKSNFLAGTVLFTGSATRLRARWATLPTYATRPNRYSGFQPARALVEVPESEAIEMGRLYREWVTFNLRNLSTVSKRTSGRFVVRM